MDLNVLDFSVFRVAGLAEPCFNPLLTVNLCEAVPALERLQPTI